MEVTKTGDKYAGAEYTKSIEDYKCNKTIFFFKHGVPNTSTSLCEHPIFKFAYSIVQINLRAWGLS